MHKHNFTIIIEKDPDGTLIASVPNLKGCHTQAKTLPILMSRIKEAIELCLEVGKENLSSSKFVGLQEIEVSI
ncbi:MAG: type II toxin-antitoxin system HicB family antitoxin [Candidatus Omnitrophica bacterium]|nr:type II toxin-antitoxin system HicB family antitoxin [Candidatus Omnitrophota bacterium]MCA9406443.1 type II toxin-antitoxin system HicB family antitoxin [Candidatus Omnitrophota bacterium]